MIVVICLGDNFLVMLFRIFLFEFFKNNDRFIKLSLIGGCILVIIWVLYLILFFKFWFLNIFFFLIWLYVYVKIWFCDCCILDMVFGFFVLLFLFLCSDLFLFLWMLLLLLGIGKLGMIIGGVGLGVYKFFLLLDFVSVFSGVGFKGIDVVWKLLFLLIFVFINLWGEKWFGVLLKVFSDCIIWRKILELIFVVDLLIF